MWLRRRNLGPQLPHEISELTDDLALESLSLCRCGISEKVIYSLISQLTLKDLQLQLCFVDSQVLKALLSKPSLVSRFGTWSCTSTSADLVCMSQYTRLEYLSIRILANVLPDLAKYLPRFRALSELRIDIQVREGLSTESEALLLSAICGCHSLRNIDFRIYQLESNFRWGQVYGLQPSSVVQVLISQSRTLQYLKVLIHKPLQQTYEHAITEVLRVVRTHNHKLRMFKLFTTLEDDKRKELTRQLRKAIGRTEREIEQLTIEIVRNECANILHIVATSNLEFFS